MNTGNATTSGCSADSDARPEYGWRDYGRQAWYATAVFLLPIAIGVLGAIAIRRWFEYGNVTNALTGALALVGVLYVRDFANFVADSELRNEQVPTIRSARAIPGLWALMALLMILAHLLTNDADVEEDADDAAASAFDGASVEVGLYLETDSPYNKETALNSTSSLRDTHITDASIAPASEDAPVKGTHLVHVDINPHSRSAAETRPIDIQDFAVGLTLASLVAWLTTTPTLRLMRSPDPPVPPLTRLWAALIDLVVPAAVVLLMWNRFGSWFDTWRSASLAVFGAVAVWQMLLTRADSAGARHWLGNRIVAVGKKGRRLEEPLGWLRSAWRATLLGALLAWPAGVLFDLINEVGGPPPFWMWLASPSFVFVVFMSITAHPGGRALHDLFSWTEVVPVREEQSDSSEEEPEQVGADSEADTES